MKEYIVDVSTVSSWQEFIAAFNQGFIRQFGGEWNSNLDSFNDYLYWPTSTRIGFLSADGKHAKKKSTSIKLGIIAPYWT